MDGKVDYRGLGKLLIDKNIKNKSKLIELEGISTNVLAKLNRGDFISCGKPPEDLEGASL